MREIIVRERKNSNDLYSNINVKGKKNSNDLYLYIKLHIK